MKHIVTALLLFIIALFAAGFVVYTLRVQILTGLADILVVNDPLQPADIIFILNGDVTTRPFHAAELYRQGLAPQIVIARVEETPATELGFYPNVTDVTVEILARLGVPAQNLTVVNVEGGVTSTRDESKVLHQYVETHKIKRIIVVTSAFHTRRAKWTFDQELADLGVAVQLSAAPQWKFSERDWWQSERGLITFANEYIKLFYYVAAY